MNRPCIACGFHITYPVYQSKDQPLCALHLPKSEEEARAVLRYPLNYQACANCGHVFNLQFEYYQVPYEQNSNLMFNSGRLWTEHMTSLIDELVETYDAAGKTLVDIGCGDGGFLKILVERNLETRCIGFEPGIESANARKNGLEVYKDYFVAERNLRLIRPDFLICRHVIEHLPNPREFVSSIAFWCNRYGLFPIFLAEVPRIDKAIQHARVNDYLYEHVSNFTEFSFINMLEISGFELLDIRSAYGDEVVIAFARPRKLERYEAIHQHSSECYDRIREQRQSVHQALDQLLQANKKVAFWGGTGKGAAFLNAFEVDVDKFPIVVDSDYNKLDKFVPRMAQQIRPPEYLIDHPVDVIVVTTQWRAKDIFQEIQRREIPYESILVLLNGELVPYNGEDI